MKTKNITIHRNQQNIFVVAIQVVIFLTAFCISTTSFAQEKEPSKEAQNKKTEIVSEEKNDTEVTSTKEGSEPVKVQLSKEQQQQIEELDALLKAEKITQEEYDNKKADILGVKTEASKSLSIAQIEPEAQTLGKYVAPQVSTVNGSLNFSYPIVVPTGRNNLTPDLSLEYNSTNKSHSSQIATGWSFNIPYIQRVNKTGTDDLYTIDTFTSSLDGELIHQGNGMYTPRVENGTFLKYQYSNDTWTITDKTGTIYEFGTTTQARQDDPNDATKIFSWMLETITDTNGNAINYSYYKDQGQIYPDTISYAIHEIIFNKSPRTASYTSYTPTFKVTTAFLIDAVLIKTNGTLVRDYTVQSSDDLVEEIQLTGYQDSESSSLPPLEIEYSHQGANTDFIHDTDLAVSERYPYGIRFADVDGDGDQDIIASYRQHNGNNLQYLKLNTDSGWQTATWTFPSDYGLVFYDYNSQKPGLGDILDVNGDGRADLVFKNSQRRKDWKFYINTGSGWSLDTSWAVRDRYPHGSRFVDVNGDQLVDIVTSYWRNGNHYRNLRLNTGSGWEIAPWLTPDIWQLSFYDYSSQQSNKVQTPDVNGDSLADLVYQNSNGQWDFYINTGSGWQFDATWGLTHQHPRGTRFAHANGDGLIDVISSYYQGGVHIRKVELNTGSGWQTHALNLPDQWPMFFYDTNENSYGNGDMVDIDGDGLSDFVYKDTESRQDWKFYLNTSVAFANISKFTSPYGGTTELSYTIAQGQNSSNKVPFPIEVIEAISTSDRQGNRATTSYQYTGADLYYNTPHDKKFAGFKEVIKTNADGSTQTTKYHQGNGEQINEPIDSYAKIGKPYEQTIENALGNLFRRIRMNYSKTNLGGISNSIQTESELSQHYDGTNSHTDTAIVYQYDNYGNVTIQTQYGEVEGNSDGTFSDTGTDKRTSAYSYTANTSDYIVGLPTNQTLKNSSNVKEAETNYSYDAKGNLLTESKWITGSDYADTTYSYDSYANVLTHTNPLNHTTSYIYDGDNLYPVSVTNALSQTTNYQYDYSSGKVTQMTDPNGKQTHYDYDGLDRLIEIKTTIGNGASEVLKDMSYHTTTDPQYTKTTTYTATESQDVYSYSDGFGKTIQTKSEMDSNWLTLDTQYDAMRRVEKQSLPYESLSFSHSNPITNNDLFTIFTYDALGRVLNTTNTKGVTTTSYDGFQTSVTDAENHQKDLITDAFGNLMSVREYNSGAIYTTDYQYNAQNLLTNISDAENNKRTITYDGLGRRTSLEDLHSSSDTSFGTWSFNYDDMNLTTQIDPNGTTTHYSYDGIGRVLTEDNSGTLAVDVNYSYDNCSNGIGYLCSVVTPDLTSNYTYLKQGLVDTESNIIDGITYTSDTDYNWQGNVTKVTHPNASYTEYEYNTRAMADHVKYNGASLVTAEYGVHGRPTSISHANGIISTFSYDTSKLYELVSKVTTNGTTTFQDLNYTYDKVGNISQIIDGSDTDTAKTQTFSYDDLYRLTGVTVTNSANASDYTRNYTYSPIGNITAFDGVTYSYTDTGYSNPHAVTNIGGISYSYDHNGNLTSDGRWTYTWDYRNRLRNSTNGTATSTYTYDHDNRRIKRIEGSDTTVYPTADYEIHNGNVKVSLSLADILVATDDNGIINHVHTDHLGGTHITTDTTGAITQTLDYYPYGDTRIDIGTTNESKQFTGYVKDASTELSYAGARYYSGKNGRFISQDPANLRLGINEKFEFKKILTNPQLLNTYSYASNDPINNIDDNGELSLRSALTNPFAIPISLGLSAIAEYGGNKYNIPVSQQLLQHSLSLEPRDQYAGEGSDIVNLIKNSEQFQNKLSDKISGLEKKGQDIAFTKIDLKFTSREGDVYSAFSRIDLVVQGSQNENGDWNLTFSGSDTYDYGFNFSDYTVDKFGVGANVLYGAQESGILTPFDTHVEFKEKNYTPKKQTEKKNNEKKR